MPPSLHRIAVLLLCLLLAPAAEPLVCRGFPAQIAAEAVAGRCHRLVLLDLEERQLPLWFALPGQDEAAAGQALAHALGCWWSAAADAPLRLGRSPRLAPGRQEVRAYSSPLAGHPGAEGIATRLLDPWLGAAGGLVLDRSNGVWSATLDRDGHLQAGRLLTLLGTDIAQAPHLVADPADPGPELPLQHLPVGADLGAWAIDLARCSGLAVALAPGIDPAQPAPASATTLGGAIHALGERGLLAEVRHGCVCIGNTAAGDLRHPAQRREFAVVPVGHLCRNDAELERFAARLGARVGADGWRLPGWGIIPVAWTRCLLIAGDAPAIHAALAAIEAADAIGLEAWSR